MGTLAVTFLACESKDTHKSESREVDNTARNTRDTNFDTLTPEDQSESKPDRTISQNIRKALMSDDTLSQNAKNLKIITIDGVVTLRGVVNSPQEKDLIARKANAINGVKRIENQLDVK